MAKAKVGNFSDRIFMIEEGESGQFSHADSLDAVLEDTDYDETYVVAEYGLVSVKKFKRETVAVEVK